MSYTIDQLKAAGGSLWEKGAMRRVYFNNLPAWYGLEVERYNTGNICSARLDGEPISNGKASKLFTYFDLAKVWYDVNADRFESRGLDAGDLNEIVKPIEAKIADLDAKAA